MGGTYAYTHYIWPSVLTVLLLIALAVFSGRRRRVLGATWLMIVCLIGAAWATCWVMEAAALNLATKITWVKVQGILGLPIVTAITCFLLEYAWPGRRLTRRNLILLSIPCLLFLGLALTNDLHHLLWLGFAYEGKTIPLRGPFLWIFAAWAFVGLGILNLIVFAWLFRRSPQHRWPVVLMVTGQIVGRMTNVLDARVLQSALPINVLGLAFEFLMYAIALFGFRILDPIPLARRTAIEQLRSGMLVLDPQGRIVSLNPAASAILGSPAKRLLGRSIQDLLPASANLAGDLQAVGAGQIEISLPVDQRDDVGTGPATRYYQLEASSLNDWRGLEVGRLLLLHDVTEQKRAQAQLMEQQRALAMLSERERLARELHDGIGQVLGFASLKMGATRKLIADGKLVKADDQLSHLEGIMADAHADVREYILNLRVAPSEEKPFFSTLRQYLDGFHQNYGIRVDVSIGAGVDESIFTPDAQMQLFRILQEAFSNARKHAETNCVQVSFELHDSLVRIRIQDDGKGFDPAQSPTGDRHFGLKFMRERAETLGGTLQVQSALGEGTCVEVTVPISRETRMG